MSKPQQRNSASRKKLWGHGARVAGLTLLASGFGAVAAQADQVVSCGGFAMLGGAQMNCSHMVPKAPTQFCTFSWALMTTAGSMSTAEGSFLLAPGSSNVMVYQAGGFNSALSPPIVLCQGKKSR